MAKNLDEVLRELVALGANVPQEAAAKMRAHAASAATRCEGFAVTMFRCAVSGPEPHHEDRMIEITGSINGQAHGLNVAVNGNDVADGNLDMYVPFLVEALRSSADYFAGKNAA